MYLANQTVTNLLSCDTSRIFWVRYAVGDVTVGRDRYDRNVLLRYEDTDGKVGRNDIIVSHKFEEFKTMKLFFRS